MKQVIIDTLKKEKVCVMGLLITIVVIIAGSILPPLFLQYFLDHASQTSFKEQLLFFAICYFGVISLSICAEALKEYQLGMIGSRLIASTRKAIMDKWKHLSCEYFQEEGVDKAIAVMLQDVEILGSVFSNGLVSLGIDLMKLFSIIIAIYSFSMYLALMMIVVLPFLLWFTYYVQKKMAAVQVQFREEYQNMLVHVRNGAFVKEDIVRYDKQAFMAKRFDKCVNKSYTLQRKTYLYDGIYPTIMKCIRIGLIALILLSAVMEWWFTFSLGSIAACVDYVGRLFDPLDAIGMQIVELQASLSGYQRIVSFLKDEREEEEREALQSNASVSIQLKQMSFHYPKANHALFDGINLTLSKGNVYGFVGESGNGKSTLFYLLDGLYKPTKGQVLVNGQAASLIKHEDKASLIGYINQDFTWISDTLFNQLTLHKEIKERSVIELMEYLGLDSKINSLPDGYNTFVEYGCTLFTQGEKQLLSFARAYLAHPSIYLLDEINAHIDSEHEERLWKLLLEEDALILCISHRTLPIDAKLYLVAEGQIQLV